MPLVWERVIIMSCLLFINTFPLSQEWCYVLASSFSFSLAPCERVEVVVYHECTYIIALVCKVQCRRKQEGGEATNATCSGFIEGGVSLVDFAVRVSPVGCLGRFNRGHLAPNPGLFLPNPRHLLPNPARLWPNSTFVPGLLPLSHTPHYTTPHHTTPHHTTPHHKTTPALRGTGCGSFPSFNIRPPVSVCVCVFPVNPNTVTKKTAQHFGDAWRGSCHYFCWVLSCRLFTKPFCLGQDAISWVLSQ